MEILAIIREHQEWRQQAEKVTEAERDRYFVIEVMEAGTSFTRQEREKQGLHKFCYTLPYTHTQSKHKRTNPQNPKIQNMVSPVWVFAITTLKSRHFGRPTRRLFE